MLNSYLHSPFNLSNIPILSFYNSFTKSIIKQYKTTTNRIKLII